jgi:predicted nucleotidyltransferase
VPDLVLDFIAGKNLYNSRYMTTKLKEIKNEIVPILKKHDVKKAAFFGSVVRGEATDKSDIDILIEFDGEKSLLDLVELKLEIEDNLGIKVDISTYNSLLPAIRDKVFKQLQPIL